MPHRWFGSYSGQVPRRETPVHRITTVHPGSTPEQQGRERTYLIMMGTRMVAIVVAVVMPGIWRWIAIVLGVFLPYIAVVMVNAARTRGTPADPAYIPPDQTPAITDRPYSGRIIPHDHT